VALTLQPMALLALTAAVVLTRIWFPEHWSYFNNIQSMFALAPARNLAVCLVAVLLLFGGNRRVAVPMRWRSAAGRLRGAAG
jgi:hypothetical protein